ncbi:hypothetical protein [Marinobacter sp.]|uniref:hypothetical protein n=1 Tax=Marinobacter sp. TaxID=50741 RepID=UPI00261571C0|nr:hypothetical protein [Marinobacter sp.]
MKSLVDQEISISEFRRSPTKHFGYSPVAVLLRGRPRGYLLSVDHFEVMLAAIAECEDPVKLKEKLGLSDAWLEKILSKDSDFQ